MQAIQRIFALMIIVFVYGCGNSSSGNSNSTLSTGVRYAGNTNPVTLEPTNASIVATKSLSSQSEASGISTRSITTQSAIEITRRIIRSHGYTKTSEPPVAGDCGGSYTLSIDTDNSSGYSGHVDYAGYCTGTPGINGPSVTLDGTVLFSGVYDTLGQTASEHWAFTEITVTGQPGNIQIKSGGTFDFVFASGTLQNVSESVVIRDNAGKTIWLDHYVVAIAGAGMITINGRMYLSDYGYVDIETTSPLLVNGQWPTGGQLVLSGARGTRAQLTAYSNGYTLALDPGTGTFDAPGAIMPWPVT